MLRFAGGMGAMVWLVAVCVRITSDDAKWPILTYATPWPVLMLGALIFAQCGGGWWWRRLGVGAALLCAGVWLHGSWRWPHGPAAAPELRVVHWNVSRPEQELTGIAQRLRALDADVIAVAEARPKQSDATGPWEAEFPGYRAIFAPGNLLCLVRGEVLRHEEGLLVLGSYYSLNEVRIRGREVTILQVDFAAQLDQLRDRPLRAVTVQAAAAFGKPLVVLGDFNTPRDSVHFTPLRRLLANAWETAGSGLTETWPWPLPVLALDQIWSSAELRAVQCRSGGSWLSDHRWVVADFVFAPVAP